MKKINFKKDFNHMLTFKNKKKQSGFTLVELMVVIAILGLLVSVVWGQVTNALLRGKDTAIREDMENIRKLTLQDFIAMNTKYSTSGVAFSCGPGGGTCSDCFSAGCTSYLTNTILANPNTMAALADVKNQNGGFIPYVEINATGTAFAIAVTLRTSGKYWCIDGNGVAKDYYGATPTNYYSGQNGISASQYGIWQGVYACN